MILTLDKHQNKYKLIHNKYKVMRNKEDDINIYGLDKDIMTEDLCLPKSVKVKLTGQQVFNLYELRHSSKPDLRNIGLSVEEVDQIETALARVGRQLGYVL